MPILIFMGADITALVIGAVVLLLVYAAQTFTTYLLAPMFEKIPIIGTLAAATLKAAVTVMEQRVTQWFGYAASPLIGLIYSFPSGINYFISYTNRFADRVVARFATVAHDVGVALGVSAIAANAINALNKIIGLTATVTQLNNDFKAVQAALSATEATLKGIIATEAANAVREAENWAEQEILRRVGIVAATVTALQSTLAQDITNITGRLATDIAGVTSLVNQIENTLSRDISNLDTMLRDIINTDVAQVEADIGANAEAITQIIAQVTTIADTLTTTLEQCVNPLCENLTSEGEAIKDLTNLFDAGAFMALITEMITNPTGTAESVTGAVSGFNSDVSNLIQSLFKK